MVWVWGKRMYGLIFSYAWIYLRYIQFLPNLQLEVITKSYSRLKLDDCYVTVNFRYLWDRHFSFNIILFRMLWKNAHTANNIQGSSTTEEKTVRQFTSSTNIARAALNTEDSLWTAKAPSINYNIRLRHNPSKLQKRINNLRDYYYSCYQQLIQKFKDSCHLIGFDVIFWVTIYALRHSRFNESDCNYRICH